MSDLDGVALGACAAALERAERVVAARCPDLAPEAAQSAARSAFRRTHEVVAGEWRRRSSAALRGPAGVVLDLTRPRARWHG